MATSITNTSISTDTINVDNGVLYVDSTNNRVGVNDSTPGYALDITGDVRVDTVSEPALYVRRTSHTGGITDYQSIVDSAALYINGNTDGGTDSLRIGAMHNGTGDYYIDAANWNGSAPYDILLNPLNGKVGVATTDAFSVLTVARDGIDPSNISFKDSSNIAHMTLVGKNANVRLQMGTYDVDPYAGYIQASYDNNPGGSGNSGPEPLVLNPAGGVVLMPNQPKFHAWATAGANQAVAAGTVPTSWNTMTNVGSHFSNGVFTAPRAGTYRFYYSILNGSTGGYGLCEFHKNDSGALGGGITHNWGQVWVDAVNNDNTVTREVIIELAQNDYVNLYVHPTHNNWYWQNGYSYFGGHLLL